jgi:hypothetical protein
MIQSDKKGGIWIVGASGNTTHQLKNLKIIQIPNECTIFII